MSRLHRHAASTVAIVLATWAALHGVVSCAENAEPDPVTVDAAPAPDSATVIPAPDAAPPPHCGKDAWCAVALPPSPVSLNGIWGSAADDVWIVGSPDLTMHWNGSELATGKTDSRQTLFGVWGSGKNDVWTYSAGNAMWHSAGFGDAGPGWSRFDGGGGDGGGVGWPGPISAMWGRSATDIWAVGPFIDGIGTPTIWHSDGWKSGAPTWAFAETSNTEPPHPEALSFNAIWGTAKSSVWIVGMGGKTRVGNGMGQRSGTWTAVNSSTSYDLHAVWGSADGDVWAGGAGGTMRHFTSVTGGGYVATSVTLPTDATIYGITGFAANDVWAVGSGGVVLHFDGKAWLRVTVPVAKPAEDDLFAIWGSAPDDLWIVGRNTLLYKGSAALPGKSP